MRVGAPQVPNRTPAVRELTGPLLLASGRLSDDEERTFERLRSQLQDERPELEKCDAYYRAVQKLVTLGISYPPELANADIRAVMGWPRIAADSVHERIGLEGFRYPDALDADQTLWDIWQDNNLDLESDLAHLDALVMKRSFIVAGTREDSDSPLITVESPLAMTASWDNRRRHPRDAVQFYEGDDQSKRAALYIAGQTITLASDGDGGWEVVDRDEHRLPYVPVMMMANRARTHERSGASEITAEVMAITDAGCRTLLDLEVAREFYAVPQRFVLGATQDAFQNAEGQTRSAWETIRGRVWALERDEEGNVPSVGQFQPMSPTAYTEILNSYAEIMASITGLPPFYLGRTADQPASAEAIRFSTDRLIQKVRLKHKAFEQAWEGAMRMALAFQRGSIPDEALRIETIWRNPEIPTPGATSDAISKQIAAGYLPAQSDVTGERLGYSPLERARIERDRGRAAGNEALEAISRRLGAEQTTTAPTPADTVEPPQADTTGATTTQ